LSVRPGVAALALLLLVGALAAPGATSAQDHWKRTSISIPDSTAAGEWDGTWWYVNRDAKLALWIQTVDGKPQVKVQFENLKAIENFTSDWSGIARYTTHNGAGNFALKLSEADANTIKADWDWTFVVGRSTRQERGKVTIFRSGTGRQLVVRFDSFEFYIGPVDEIRWQKADQALTFRKASKRQIRWEELPF
jgi:hypothetical protein